MKLPIMQLSAPSRPSISLQSRYSQHHLFEYLVLVFHPQCQEPSFTPIQNHRQNYNCVCCNF
jgi:hypothetical protein